MSRLAQLLTIMNPISNMYDTVTNVRRKSPLLNTWQAIVYF